MVVNYLKKSIVIHPCQVSEVDQPDENNIRKISNETVYNWERMIREGGELSETKVDVINMRYKIDNNNLVKMLEPIYGEIVIKKKMLIPIEKAQIGDNLQKYVLCDIIKTQLLLNYLQYMVIEEILYHTITVK